MTNLQLILSDSFNARPVNVYRDSEGHELLTRQQIADMLGVSVDAIRKIHDRSPGRLNAFSVTDKLSGTDGKLYETYLYTFKGVLEICRHSNSPIAHTVIDFVWDLADRLRQGQITPSSYDEIHRLDIGNFEIIAKQVLTQPNNCLACILLESSNNPGEINDPKTRAAAQTTGRKKRFANRIASNRSRERNPRKGSPFFRNERNFFQMDDWDFLGKSRTDNKIPQEKEMSVNRLSGKLPVNALVHQLSSAEHSYLATSCGKVKGVSQITENAK